MTTAVGILLLVISLVSVIVVLAAFVWAARKDGEKDRALQRRLGIKPRTRHRPLGPPGQKKGRAAH